MYPAPVLKIARFEKGAGFLREKSCKATYLKASALSWCFLLIIEPAGTTGTHLTWQIAVLPLKWSAPVSKNSDFKRGAGNSGRKSYNTEKGAGPVAAGWRHWKTGSAYLFCTNGRNNKMGKYFVHNAPLTGWGRRWCYRPTSSLVIPAAPSSAVTAPMERVWTVTLIIAAKAGGPWFVSTSLRYDELYYFF